MSASGDLLVLNSGSSSLKFAVYALEEALQHPDLKPRFRGRLTGLDEAPWFHVQGEDGHVLEDRSPVPAAEHNAGNDDDGDDSGSTEGTGPANAAAGFSQAEALSVLMDWLDDHAGDRPLRAAGHRVVHGGRHLREAVAVNADTLAQMEALIPLAPLHQPHNLAPMRTLAETRPDLFQVACFDTAFHHTQPEVERRLALPRALFDEGMMRYGFHGLSYEYIQGALARELGRSETGRVIVAHLGSGASLAALRDGRSVATTMGFTALDGLPMSTRTGSLDPGAVLYLLQAKGMSAAQVSTMLYEESGLLGLSGISGDIQALLDSADPAADEAVAVFVYRTIREIGALVAVLGGLDHLVFTAGIGEHAHSVRARVCAGFDWLGLALDPEANAKHATLASRPESTASVWILPTNEEWMIARHTLAVLETATHG